MIQHNWLFLALQGLILLVLVVQYLQGGRLSRSLDHWHATTRERQRRDWWHAEENRELKQALQAEKILVAQLQRSLEQLRTQA